jgi:L-ascorbate metabolism protein UlaG (beta-lactamase superfamily)
MRLFLAVAACAALAVSAQAQTARPVQTLASSAGPIKITPVYHAALVIEAGGKVIIVDPAKPADFTGLPQADLILISHEHGDHMDPDLAAKVSKTGTEIWANAATKDKIPSAQVINNGDTKKWGAFTIEAVPAYNIVRGPSAGKFYHPKDNGNGYVISYGGKRIYITGDTENIPEMAAIKNIDMEFVCINLPYTMTPDEAAAAVKVVHPKVVIPYHYRASTPTDLNAFKTALDGSGIEVRLLEWYPKS